MTIVTLENEQRREAQYNEMLNVKMEQIRQLQLTLIQGSENLTNVEERWNKLHTDFVAAIEKTKAGLHLFSSLRTERSR